MKHGQNFKIPHFDPQPPNSNFLTVWYILLIVEIIVRDVLFVFILSVFIRSLMVMSTTLNRVEAFHIVPLSYDLSDTVV